MKNAVLPHGASSKGKAILAIHPRSSERVRPFGGASWLFHVKTDIPAKLREEALLAAQFSKHFVLQNRKEASTPNFNGIILSQRLETWWAPYFIKIMDGAREET